MNATDAPSNTAASRLRVRLSALALSLLVALGLPGCSADDATPGSANDPGANPTAGKAPEPASDQIEQLLLSARTALNERRLLAPAGDNAIESYLAVLDLESNHVAARQALLELLPSASDAVERAIVEGDLEEAQRRFDLFKRMGGSELRLGPLRSQLADARARIEARAAADAAPEVIEPAPLTDPPRPAGDIAAAAPGATAEPAPPAAQPVRPVVTTSTPTPSVAPTVDDAAPAAASSPVAAVETAPATSAPATPAPTVAKVVEPRQVVDVVPSYPQAARQRRIEGWVELEFAIGADGRVGDVSVVRSDPPQIFDREAVRAAVRWRFEPRREDGVAVATRGRKTLNFRLKAG